MFKQLILRFTPKFVLRTYHLTLAVVAAWWYGYPSEKLMVIGVTGTKGKSTTANFIAQLLELAGHKVGLTSTATMKVAEREWLSTRKMTMPGRFELQRLLADMVRSGCEYAVIETSSEGIEQFRSRGVHYDTVLLTNFTPEHIEAHGSYENYRAAKGKLFEQLKKSSTKILNGKSIPKHVILNRQGGEYDFFSAFQAGELWHFGLSESATTNEREVVGKQAELKSNGSSFICRDQTITIPFLFQFNILNVLAATAVCMANGFSFSEIAVLLPKLKAVPGRQEFIDEGQPFKVMVDYTYEPASMRALYENLSIIPHAGVIHVLGSTGGGRDSWRRPVMGEIAAANASIVIATTDDPYDDDPNSLADELLAGAEKVRAGSHSVELLKIIDRRAAIREALQRAQPNDLVLITGKGAEQKMAVAHGRYIPWDDRQVVRDELRSLHQ